MTPTCRLALGAALTALALSAASEAARPHSKPAPDACPAQRTQQQAGAVAAGSGSAKAGPDGQVRPTAEGAPASAPTATLTLTGTDRAAAPQASGTLPAECAAGGKITKSRSNIQNN